MARGSVQIFLQNQLGGAAGTFQRCREGPEAVLSSSWCRTWRKGQHAVWPYEWQGFVAQFCRGYTASTGHLSCHLAKDVWRWEGRCSFYLWGVLCLFSCFYSTVSSEDGIRRSLQNTAQEQLMVLHPFPQALLFPHCPPLFSTRSLFYDRNLIVLKMLGPIPVTAKDITFFFSSSKHSIGSSQSKKDV